MVVHARPTPHPFLQVPLLPGRYNTHTCPRVFTLDPRRVLDLLGAIISLRFVLCNPLAERNTAWRRLEIGVTLSDR